MPLITEKIVKNAEKCQECAFQLIRTHKLDRQAVLFDEVDALVKMSCSVCPIRPDFEKIHGVKPMDYFAKGFQMKID